MTEDLLNEIVEELNKEKLLAEVNGEKIDVLVNIEDTEILLYTEVSNLFPYEIPSIYIDEDSIKKLPTIPHMYTNGSICLYDKGMVVPNFMEPVQLMKDCFYKAISIIEKGIKNENKLDFITELTEYWSVRKKTILKGELFSDQLDSGVQYWRFIDKQIIIANTKEEVKRIEKNIIYTDTNNEKTYEALCVNVNGDTMSSIPKNDYDIIQIIKASSKDFLRYSSFLQRNIDKFAMIMLNISCENGNMIIGWVHDGPGKQNGFRKGHENIELAYLKNQKKSASFGVEIVNCSQNRLFQRGSCGLNTDYKMISIIGCGSIGSHVVESMISLGSSNFQLIDPDKLEIENVARHYCGYFTVGLSKVEAIKFVATKRNPNLNIECVNKDFHEFVNQEVASLNNYNLIIDATAELSVEYRLNELLKTQTITKPVLSMWIEPYGIAGHALLLQKGQNLFEELFDKKTLEFNKRVVVNQENYFKHEAGCQSSYIPYSGFEIQLFINQVLKKGFEYIGKKTGNYLFTWIGEVSKAHQYNMSINEDYIGQNDYSIIVRRVD